MFISTRNFSRAKKLPDRYTPNDNGKESPNEWSITTMEPRQNTETHNDYKAINFTCAKTTSSN